MFDSIGSALDTASSLLGGAQPGGAAADAKPEYTRGEDLRASDSETGGAYAPDDLGGHNAGATIEFIHYGYVHPDDSDHFAHESLNDIQPQTLPQGPTSRAIMFRAALQREILNLAGFVHATQAVLEEKESSLGGVGEMIGAVTDLIGGGGGGGTSAPKAADLNAVNDKLVEISGAINTDPLTYKILHQAGRDLHQARANYRAFLQKVQEQPQGEDQGGLLSSVGAIASAIPGVGGIFGTIAGIITKAFDIFVAVYIKTASELEKSIEKACHDLSIESITGNAPMIFPVWSPPPAPADAGESSSSLPGFLGDAVDQVQETVQDIKDFFAGTQTVDCPGSAFLGQAFAIATVPPPPTDQPPPPPKEMTKLVVDAFKEQVPAAPDFILNIVSEVQTINCDFLKAVFQKLMERNPQETISEESMFEAGRRQMLDRLVNLLLDQVSFLQKAKNAGVNVQGINMSVDSLMKKGLNTLNEELGPEIDPLLRICMKGLRDRLEAARSVAVSEKAHTMEVYLGQLPALLAYMFRDTFFPIWDLFVEKVFGSISGPVGGALSSASAVFKNLKEGIDSIRDYKAKAEKVAERADKEGLQAGTGGQNITGYQDDWEDTQADRGPTNPQEEDARSDFPLKGRKDTAKGEKIDESQWTEVEKDHQWDLAKPA